MNRSNKLLWIIMVFFTFLSTAQESRDSTIQITYNQDNGNFSYFGIGPTLGVSLNAHNLSYLIGGAEARFIHKNVSFKASGRLHLLQKGASNYWGEYVNNYSIYKDEFSRDIEADFIYYYKNNRKRRTAFPTVYMKNGSSKNYPVEYEVSKRYGIGIGYKPMITYYNFGERDLDAIRLLDGASVSLDGVTASYLTQHIIRTTFSYLVSSNLEVVLKGKAGKALTYEKGFYYHYYSGFLIGFQQELDTVVQEIYPPYDYDNPGFNNIIYLRHDIQEGLIMNPVGVMMGWEFFKVKQGAFGNIGVNIEVGMMPGPIQTWARNFYADISASFMIGSNFTKGIKNPD